MLDWYPHYYQEQVLRDNTRWIILCWGRQLGKSDVVAVKALHYACTHADSVILIISPTLRQSKIIYRKMRNFITRSPILKHEYTKIIQESAELKNGAMIANVPVGEEGDAIRGFTVSLLIVDEAARVPESVFTAAEPSLASSHGDMILISTPKGKVGYFWECWNDPTYSKYHVSYEVGLQVRRRDGKLQLDPVIVERARNKLTPWEFLTEYGAEFIEEMGVFFPAPLVDSSISDRPCTYSPALAHTKLQPEPNNYYVAGIDFAKHVDATALSILEREANSEVWHQIYLQLWHDINYSAQLKELDTICRRFRVSKLYVDQTSVGEAPLDILAIDHGWGTAIEGVRCYDRQVKVDVLSNMLSMMNNNKLYVLDWPEFIKELKGIMRAATAEGKLKVEAPARMHDDRTIATAMSALIGRLPVPTVKATVMKGRDHRTALRERNEQYITRL